MPSWPAGVITVNIVGGKGITVDGELTSATATITPVFKGTGAVRWAATGTAVLPFEVTRAAEVGSPWVATVPVVDQPGWVDDSGAAYSFWAYRVEETPRFGRNRGKTRTRYVQPVIGQGDIDFDEIVAGEPGDPVAVLVPAVTSVNGLTGDVTLPIGGADPETIAAAVAAYLEDNPVDGLTETEVTALILSKLGPYATAQQVTTALSGYATTQALSDGLGNKVNSSTYTAGLATKANTADLAAVAQSGSYNDLANKPTIPTTPGQVGAAAASHSHPASQITDFNDAVTQSTEVLASTTARHTHANKTTLDQVTAAYTAAEKTKLGGVATGATANSSDAQLRDRSTHTGTQAASTVTGLAAVATSGSKADVGLGNVDNTSDASKPVSTAQATAIAAKLDTTAAPELIRDTIGATLVAGSNVTITVNDTADTITVASTASGSGSTARTDNAQMYGYRAMSFDPAVMHNTFGLGNQGYLVKVIALLDGLITGVGIAPSTVTSPTGVRAALYKMDGTQIAATADFSSSLAGDTPIRVPFASSVTVATGDMLYVGLFKTGGTLSIQGQDANRQRINQSAASNSGGIPGGPRFGAVGATTPPSPLDFSVMYATNSALFVALY